MGLEQQHQQQQHPPATAPHLKPSASGASSSTSDWASPAVRGKNGANMCALLLVKPDIWQAANLTQPLPSDRQSCLPSHLALSRAAAALRTPRRCCCRR